MSKNEERGTAWQRKFVVPNLAISANGNALSYHEILANTEGCAPGEVNTFTYTPEHPEGIAQKVPRWKMFGLLNSHQFGTAAQWGWPGLDHITDLVFGDPDWSLLPHEGEAYDIAYIPRMTNTLVSIPPLRPGGN